MSRYTITAYADGFTLPIDDYLTIASTGTIGGAGLTAENRSTTVNDGAIHPLMGQAAYGYGGNGGNGVNGVTLTTATLTNNGTVAGGAAAAGGVGPTSYYYGSGYGGAGGAAGIGVSGSGSIANYGAIVGGAGGAGGQGGFALISDSIESGGYGGQAGAGGAAVNLKTGAVVNEGFLVGGQGGTGGAGAGASGSEYGLGGLGAGGAAGGAGVIMNGGSFANFQYALGGDGGNGGAGGGAGANTAAFGGNGGNGGAGGTAVALTGVTAYLSGYIIAGYGGTGGAGGIATGSSHDPMRATAGAGGAGGLGGSGLVVTGESVASFADIYGGAGGAGGLGGAAGAYGDAYGGAGGLGGAGGAGLVVTSGTFSNNEGVVGGAGGTGGSGGVAGGPGSTAAGGASGNGGTGGAGVVLAGGLVTNFDVIYGGAGGKGGTAQGAFDQYTAVGSNGTHGISGNGVDVTDGGTVVNRGTISGAYGVADTGHGAVTVINSGTIFGGVHFEASNDKFVVDAGSTVYGLIDGRGGTMAFNGSSGDFNYLNRAGTGEFYGGAFGVPLDFGTYSFYGGAQWTLTGMAVINPTQTLDIADATVSIESLGLGFETSFFDGGRTSLGVGGVIAGYGGAYFYNYGLLTGGGAIYGTMVVTNEAAGTIDDDVGTMLIDNQNGGGLDNAGLIESTGTGSLGLKDVTISGAGTILSKALIKLEDATIEGGTVIVNAGGELDVVSSASTITSGVTVTNNGVMRIEAGAPLTLESNLKNTGTIDIDGTGVAQAYLALVGNVTLSGSGAVSLNADGAISGYGATVFTNFNTITGGQTIFGSMTVVNRGVIDDDSGVMLVNNQFGGGWTNLGTIESANTGQLALEDITLSGAGTISDGHRIKLTSATIKAGTLTVKGGALLEASGGSSTIAAAVDLTNDQTLEAVSGGLTIAGAIDNASVIETAQTGSIAIDGAVTGSGLVRIAGSGSLNLDGACAQEVAFTPGATGRLILGAASNFTGMIAGLSRTGTNAVDLKGVIYKSTDKAVFGGGVLSIETSGGTVLATLHLKGNYNGQAFTLANDGSGDTLVTDPPASGPLAQAMASMAPGTPATAAPVARATPVVSASLASPLSG